MEQGFSWPQKLWVGSFLAENSIAPACGLGTPWPDKGHTKVVSTASFWPFQRGGPLAPTSSRLSSTRSICKFVSARRVLQVTTRAAHVSKARRQLFRSDPRKSCQKWFSSKVSIRSVAQTCRSEKNVTQTVDQNCRSGSEVLIRSVAQKCRSEVLLENMKCAKNRGLPQNLDPPHPTAKGERSAHADAAASPAKSRWLGSDWPAKARHRQGRARLPQPAARGKANPPRAGKSQLCSTI